jgi:hypothetical protein
VTKRRLKAKSVSYYGKEYRSKFEVDTVKQLHKHKKTHPFKHKYEVDTLTYVKKPGTYLPDFKIIKPDGSYLYIEVKGVLDIDTQTKMRAVKECNPDVVIAFLFQRNNLVRKGGKMRYSDWCDKYGFPWAIKDIPERWLT